MIIKAPHPTISEPQTYLTAASAAAATSLTVANNSGFATNDYVVVGLIGQEGASIDKISGTTGTTTLSFAVDTIDFAHSVNTPVTYMKYNQVKFYLGDWSARYSTGTISITKNSATVTGSGTSWGSITTNYALLLNGKWYDIKSVDSTTQITLTENYTDDTVSSASYALVPFSSQATVSITPDQQYTQWDDTDALAEDYYRTEYYNSTSTLASTRSSIVAASEISGFSDFTLRAIEDEVLGELQDENEERRKRTEIDTDVNNAIRDLLSSVVSDVQEDYLSAYTTIDFVANVSEYSLPTDFRKLSNIWISFNGVDYVKGSPMRIGDDIPNADYSQGAPFYYIRDNVIGIRPAPTAAATAGAKIWYDRRIPSLRYEGDELPYFLRDYKATVVNYALYRAHLSDTDPRARDYKAAYDEGKAMMIRSLSDRDPSSNKRIEIINDYDLWT